MTVLEKTKRRKKSYKKMVGDFLTILTIILIFVFSLACIVFISFTFVSSASATSETKEAAEKFQEAMQYANSKRDVIQTETIEEGNLKKTDFKVGSFKLEPEKVFSDPKNQKSWYNANPTQTTYYSESTQHDTQQMANAAIAETTKDTDYKDTNGNPVPVAGKSIISSFQTRPVYKVTTNDEYIAKGNQLIKDAKNIVTGTSGSAVKCESEKKTICESTYEQKTCNEEVRTIRRICEKVPSITTYVKDIVYPNCQSLIVTQHVDNHCPSGYREVFGADMVRTKGNHWDDIRFCTKQTNDGFECYSGGYYVERVVDSNFGSGVATVPKKLHARIKISNVYFNPVKVTVINDTTGATICNNSDYGNGGIIELPYSDTQEQTFKFYATQQSCEGWFCRRDTGVLVLYIDRIAKEKIANDPVWQEACRDI